MNGNVSVYVACQMTGRDRHEQVKRAKHVKSVLEQYGIKVISPVLEESVEDVPGPLVNDSESRLKGFWSRDKYVIRRIAHVVLVDGAQDKSYGVEREYGLSRWNLWKPTVLLCPKMGLTVAQFEDDMMTDNLHIAGMFIRARFGTRWKRIKWRLAMLKRCLPKRIIDEFYSWR
jgi:hypothetical protein